MSDHLSGGVEQAAEYRSWAFREEVRAADTDLSSRHTQMVLKVIALNKNSYRMQCVVKNNQKYYSFKNKKRRKFLFKCDVYLICL